MTLDEFIERKRKLERDLAVLIQREVDRFKDETGVSPAGVSVHTIMVVELGVPSVCHRIDSVKVDINLA